MRRLGDFFSRLKLRLTHNERAEQRFADALRALVLLDVHAQLPGDFLGRAGRLQAGDDPAALLRPYLEYDAAAERELTKRVPSSQRQLEMMVDRLAIKQVHRLFDTVLASGGVDVYPSPAYARRVRRSAAAAAAAAAAQQQSKRFTINSIKIDDENDHSDDDDDDDDEKEESSILSRAIEHPDGYTLRVQPSSVDHPEAGFGVHVSGVVPPGSVVCLYAGNVYYPRSIGADVCQDNGYLIGRYDGLIIDARAWGELPVRQRRQLRAQQAAGLLPPLVSSRPTKYLNQFGIGGYVNHPPAGRQANVVWYGYDFTEANTPDSHRPYVPNQLATAASLLYPQWHQLVAPSILLVASRTIRDEELFLDYRLNPNSKNPDWYTPCNLDEAQKRWSPASILM